jgi:ubiquinone/menaquinone biosynthesis C-methylase UbiE
LPGRFYHQTYGRLFAACYDAFVAGAERAGLAERRQALLSQAHGATLELGAGTGVNIEHYPPAVTELVLSEPDEHMGKNLRRRLAASGRTAEVVAAPAERLPFEDQHFDTVVGTLVLCTIPDPAGALAEAARVLKPGGRFLFLEHVRAESPRLARWQDRLHGPWYYFGAGCNCNRPTLHTIEASLLQVETAEHAEMPKAPPIVRPMIFGAAIRPA